MSSATKAKVLRKRAKLFETGPLQANAINSACERFFRSRYPYALGPALDKRVVVLRVPLHRSRQQRDRHASVPCQ